MPQQTMSANCKNRQNKKRYPTGYLFLFCLFLQIFDDDRFDKCGEVELEDFGVEV